MKSLIRLLIIVISSSLLSGCWFVFFRTGGSNSSTQSRTVIVDGWSLVSTGNEDWYLDFSSLRIDGGFREIRSLKNYKSGTGNFNGKTYLSSIVNLRVDCGEYIFKPLNVTYYSQNMGKGDVVGYDSNPTGWSNRFGEKTHGFNVINNTCKK